MSNNGLPSMTALLGLLAVAGYQNRDKLSEWLGAAHGGRPPVGAPPGVEKALGDQRGSGAGGIGGLLGGGIGELIERFKQRGRGDVADSWVRNGPNQPISHSDLEHTIGPDVLGDLEQRTGLSRTEIVSRLSRDLPGAVDRYTPNGHVAA